MFICELCKDQLPSSMCIDGKIHQLFDVPRPSDPYIILEDIRKGRRPSNTIYVIVMLNNDPITFGRGHECNIRIGDISVSRCHSLLRLVSNGFVIKDNYSKFGTLILAQNPIKMAVNTTVELQAGRTLVNLSLKEPHTGIFKCCCSCLLKTSQVAPDNVNQTQDVMNSEVSFNPDIYENEYPEENSMSPL